LSIAWNLPIMLFQLILFSKFVDLPSICRTFRVIPLLLMPQYLYLWFPNAGDFLSKQILQVFRIIDTRQTNRFHGKFLGIFVFSQSKNSKSFWRYFKFFSKNFIEILVDYPRAGSRKKHPWEKEWVKNFVSCIAMWVLAINFLWTIW
jgi:hypothetical protein